MSDHSSHWSSHREAVALFPSREAALEAVDLLQSHGVDQARISILGRGGDEEASAFEREGFGTLRDILDKADALDSLYPEAWDGAAARSAPVSSRVYVAAAPRTPVAPPVLGPLVAAAIASAGEDGGGAGDFLHHRLGGGLREPYVTETLAHGGVVLWVLLGHEDEPEVAHLLRKAGGRELRLEHVPSAAEIEAAGA